MLPLPNDPPTFTLAITHTVEDLTTYDIHAYDTSEAFRHYRRRRAASALCTIGLGATAIFLSLPEAVVRNPTAQSTLGVILFIALLAYPLVSRDIFIQYARQRRWAFLAELDRCPFHLHIYPGLFITESPFSVTAYRWEAVEAVEHRPGYTYIDLPDGEIIIIPHRVFATVEARDRFKEQVDRFYAATRASNQVAEPPRQA